MSPPHGNQSRASIHEHLHIHAIDLSGSKKMPLRIGLHGKRAPPSLMSRSTDSELAQAQMDHRALMLDNRRTLPGGKQTHALGAELPDR